MGGCRCHFRECHVNSCKYPRMHFFRFPLKEPERYNKWRQYSKMEHMTEFSEVRRKNTGICGRHFRTECFMNYKMDRLVPTAVPTIMRLSNNQALDFELDVDNGVLVTLEKTKLKHLIPPDSFECPLFLTYDNILLEKLHELQSIERSSNTDGQYIDPEKSLEYEAIMQIPNKSLSESFEILETIQVSGPTLKRPRDVSTEERPSTSTGVNKKKNKILNTTNFTVGNDIESETSIVLSSRSAQLINCNLNNDEIDIVEIDRIENTNESTNCEKQLYVRNEVFINDDSEGTEAIELFEVHRDENNLLHYCKEEDANRVDLLNQELFKVQNQLLEFQEKSKDFDILQVKFSILEDENNELKKSCKENKVLNKELLRLQMENNCIKKELSGYETLKDKFHKCSEENKKFKESTGTIESLKAEILSRKEETKELKKLLEKFKNLKPKEQRLKKEYNVENENEQSSTTKEVKLSEELNILQEKFELKLKELNNTESELIEVKRSLNNMNNENERLTQQNTKLEELFKMQQNTSDIKQNDSSNLKLDYDILQQEYSTLNQKYCKLQSLQNQEATVSTSLQNINEKAKSAMTPSTLSITKAQLFNGIKRYVSSSMVSLLRMEMFGGSDREWKSDERQVALDILRLGETVYKYFTEEWRLRLPALREVRNWLCQSQQMLEDEEDL